MSSINKVMLMGRLGKDPEAYHFESGRAKVTFSLATSETFTRDGNREEVTEWHNIVMWDKLAEIAEKYLKKGKLIYVEGKIKTRSWDDKDGNKRYTTEILADKMTMISTGDGQGGNSGGNSGYGNSADSRSNTPRIEDHNPPPPSDLDDLPF
ncbi:MAG: single-stranded DNA-binding protein [Chitinophagales bacterium]|jgi:single-strand DNA-binding protein|nr:single-stranded DNA-binding protein [Chitinophagales bacterium]